MATLRIGADEYRLNPRVELAAVLQSIQYAAQDKQIIQIETLTADGLNAVLFVNTAVTSSFAVVLAKDEQGYSG